MSAANSEVSDDDSSLRRALELEEACDGLDEDLRSETPLDLGPRVADLDRELRDAFAYELACLAGEKGVVGDRAAEAEDWLTRRAPESLARARADRGAFTPTGSSLDGRYRIIEKIGQGGMGRVYRARDEFLHREVALKLVARRDGVATNLLIQEARSVARIEHPRIVPVYDAGRDVSGEFYVASRLIEGRSLAAILRDGRPRRERALRWTLDLADALATAHAAGIIHRDVKPANILVDQRGQVWLTDFGLALRHDGMGTSFGYVGTPTYMSPEQARGESHRVDGRSDLFSLGVVLYEMLTGIRPHSGRTFSEIGRSLRDHETVPPSRLAANLPPGLDAVLDRALARRPVDRFPDMRAFANAIENCLAEEAATPRDENIVDDAPPAVTPKGIRAFDESDVDFFDFLVPGPRTSRGASEFLTRWARRLSTRQAGTPPVVVLFGPSGSGKSSIVRAGLMPRVDDDVDVHHIDAAVHQRPGALLRQLLPDVTLRDDESIDLPRGFAALRDATQERKRLIVVDQFEQWLGAGRDPRRHEDLARALRHCDGTGLQALLVVRDDHWLQMSRLMRDLELPLFEDHNTAVVDLFDLPHARRVLQAFGRGYGQLPPAGDPMPRDAALFLDDAVTALSENERVVPIRLALFADMMRGRAWSPQSLRRVGGLEGLGVRYFEDRVGGPGSPPALRGQREPLRRLLRSLLPPTGGALRSVTRTHDELQRTLAPDIGPGETDAIFVALEHDLRLLTAVAPEADDVGDAAPRYQLTHDFLVLAIRDWDAHLARRTRVGLAEITLDKKADLFALTGDAKVLPGFGTWLFLRAFSSRARWTEAQRRLMQAAGRRHLGRAGLALVILALLGALVFAWYQNESRRRAEDSERELVERFLVADVRAAVGLRQDILALPAERRRELIRDRRVRTGALDEMSSGRLDLLEICENPEVIRPRILYRLHRVSLDEALLIRSALTECGPDAAEETWSKVEGKMPDEPRLLRNALALVAWDPPQPGRDARWRAFAPRLAQFLITSVQMDPTRSKQRIEIFEPLADTLRDPLLAAFRDPGATGARRSAAAALLADYAAGNVDTLIRAIAACEPETFETLFTSAARTPRRLEDELRRRLDDTRLRPGERANLLLTLARLGRPERLWQALARPESPDVATFAALRARGFGIAGGSLFDRYRTRARSPRERYHLLLALAEYDEMVLKMSIGGFLAELQRPSTPDEDPGLIGARTWILSRLGKARPPMGPAPDALAPRRGRRLVRFENRDFVAFAAGARFVAGSPPGDRDRQSDETQRTLTISRSFALAARETTLGAYRVFDPDFEHRQLFRCPTDDCPVLRVDWHAAAAYCNFLSERAGMPRSEWCYEPIPGRRRCLRPAPDALDREGYRLPTEAEWEYCCRAGMDTSRSWGDTEAYLPAFAWGNGSSEERSWPVGSLRPNPWGFFDLLGNAMEWCHDEYPREDGEEDDSAAAIRRVLRGGAYYNQPSLMRSADRVRQTEDYLSESIGFRVCRTLPSPD